jgi:2-polyprenyl-6-hydroxyphenyl methylase/3-demethylubiquinone-9 3-methyltransferase
MKNVDQHELDAFNAMAQSWWDPQGPCKPLHQLNPVRMHYIQSQTSLEGKFILDVGCGGGILSEAMAKAGGQVTGLELAPQVIDIARQHAEKSDLSIDYQSQLVEDYAQIHPGRFDVLTCMEMLEHVPDPASIIRACGQLLKPSGLLVLSTLNRHPMAFIQAIIGAEYVLKLLPKGTHTYGQFIRPSELDPLLREAGLEIQDIRGLSYNPLTQAFKLSNNISVNYLMSARKG